MCNPAGTEIGQYVAEKRATMLLTSDFRQLPHEEVGKKGGADRSTSDAM